MSAADFWAIVDSGPSWDGQRGRNLACSCYSTTSRHSDICDLVNDWETTRDRVGMQACLALKSNGDRCDQRVTSTFPFCKRFHADSAIIAFVEHLAATGTQNINYGHFEPSARAIAALVQFGMYGHLGEQDKKQLGTHLGMQTIRVGDERPAKPIENCVRRCALYRHFDADGALLYVGISVDPVARAKSHQAGSPWWEFVSSSDVDWYLTEVDAAAAERRAIAEEAPIFNKAGASPERDARAIQYLIAHEAYGLLRTAA